MNSQFFQRQLLQEQTRTFLEDLEDFVLKAEEWKQVASTQKYKTGQSYNEQIFLCL